MADWTKTVDPGGTGDYSSLSLAEAAAPGAGNDIYISCFSSDGSDDTTAVTFSGTGDLVEVTGSDFPSDGVWDDTKYVIKSSNTRSITISEQYVNIINIQFDHTGTSSSVYGCIIFSGVEEGGSGHIIDSCIFIGHLSGPSCANDYAIRLSDSDARGIVIKNNLINGFLNVDDTAKLNHGILSASSGSVAEIYNNTICYCHIGIASNSNYDLINNAVFNNIDDIDGAYNSLSYNAMDQGKAEGTNTVDISATWDSTCFTDTDGLGPDWSVQDTDSPLYHAGIAISGLTTDIIGTTWNDPPSIGAFEYVSAGGISIPVSMHHFRQHRR